MPRLSPPDAQQPSLESVQALMARTIMRPLTRGDGMQPDSEEAASSIIKSNDRLRSFERLQIYNQQYWWRLLGSFAEDFRGLRAVLGNKRFDKLAVAYLEKCGSTSWNLRNIGSKLEAFLREHPQLTSPVEKLALDVVRVEWARVEAFDGPEKPPIDSAKVAKTPPNRLRLSLQPYITLLELSYPIDTLMRTLKQREIETDALSNAVSSAKPKRQPRLTARESRTPIYLAVHRLKFSVYYKRLEPEAYRLLMAIRRGESIESACAEAFAGTKELPEASAEKIRTWFATWKELGWLCAR